MGGAWDMHLKLGKRARRVLAGFLALAMVLTSLSTATVNAEPADDTQSVSEKEWVFSDASFTSGDYAEFGSYTYDGLSFTNGKSHNNTYLYMGQGTISVPVEGNCTVTVESCYEYSYQFPDEKADSVAVHTGSTSQIDSYSYDYTGEAGTVV